MATTAAKTKEDVNNMSAADRLWDSLGYTYGQQIDASNKQFNKAISQNDQAMLNRGMQRSTYALQTSANLRNQAVEAANNLRTAQIADYENRLQDIENQEWQRAFQEKSFDEGVRQFNLNFDYQKDRDAVGDEQWQKAFDQSNTKNDRQLAYNYVTAILAAGKDPTDDLLARAGLSRKDANAIKVQQATGGGGGGYVASTGSYTPKKPTTPSPTTGDPDNDFVNSFDNNATGKDIVSGLVDTYRRATTSSQSTGSTAVQKATSNAGITTAGPINKNLEAALQKLRSK